jgi:hypothetical protein
VDLVSETSWRLPRLPGRRADLPVLDASARHRVTVASNFGLTFWSFLTAVVVTAALAVPRYLRTR